MRKIKNRIAEIRNNNTDLSQEDIARFLCVTKQCVSSWEKNRTQPNEKTLMLIADILKCRPDDLVYIESTAMSEIEMIEDKMRNLDNKGLDRIILYANYLKALQGDEDEN